MTVKKKYFGWLPDFPDLRDYTVTQDRVASRLLALGQKDSVRGLLRRSGIPHRKGKTLPEKVDLRSWFPPIEDQQSLGACTAHAGVALVEYFEKRAFGSCSMGSRLFLYRTTRQLLHLAGDSGATLRGTMGALVLFGIAPEEFWPYASADFDQEPPAFCYAFAHNYRTIQYYRLDPPGTANADVLVRIQTGLAAGLPAMFGFTVYDSVAQAGQSGCIPLPTGRERVVGGHAVVAAGYDRKLKIRNSLPGGSETCGALLIRNSWGAEWGPSGWGWLPFEYVLRGLAVDWWSVLKSDWINTGEFGL
jgi:C1A family cysteine protease